MSDENQVNQASGRSGRMGGTVRSARPEDTPALLTVATETGLFAEDDLPDLTGMIDEYHAGGLEGHAWIVLEEDDHETGSTVTGAAYYVPETFADGTWNLLFIGVRPGRQGRGGGGALLGAVEEALRERGQRVLIVETSGIDGFEATRAFYRAHGYDEEARIRDFYADGDDKVVFWKALSAG